MIKTLTKKVLSVILISCFSMGLLMNPIAAQAATSKATRATTLKAATKVFTTKVTVNDGFATGIINVEISLTNNRYRISKTTFSSVSTNGISLERAMRGKHLSSTIASDGSSAKVKYSYETWYLSWEPGPRGLEGYETNPNYEGTDTLQVNMNINSSTGKLTTAAVRSRVK